MHIRKLQFAALITAAVMPVIASAGTNWKKDLKRGLEETYVATKTALGGSQTIVEQGTVFVVQKEGIAGNPSGEGVLQTIVEDGTIRQASGFGVALMEIGTPRFFEPGEEVYLSGVSVFRNAVVFSVMSREIHPVTVDGSTQRTRYYGIVRFKFSPDILMEMTPKEFKAEVDRFLLPASEVGVVEPKTIEFGQSPAQVEEILGKPDKIVRAGPKTIYIYPDLKITFMNGEVADVE